MTESSAFTRIDVPDADGVPVLAYAVNGAVNGDDIDAFQADLDRCDRARLLLRIDDFGVDASVFSRKWLAMKVGALKKLERYAIIGGPDWMRAAVSIGGALAPFPVRHFESEDAARAWLAAPATEQEEEDRQEAREESAPAVTRLKSDRPDLVALAVDGRLAADDYERVVDPAIEGALGDHDKIDLLIRFDRLHGFSLGAARQDAALAKHLGRLRRMAIVGGPGWLRSLIDKFGALAPIEVDTFEDETAARAWLGDASA